MSSLTEISNIQRILSTVIIANQSTQSGTFYVCGFGALGALILAVVYKKVIAPRFCAPKDPNEAKEPPKPRDTFAEDL